VRPKIGKKLIYELKRPDMPKLRDWIAEQSGPVRADRTMAYLRKAFNWQEQYEEEWTNPIGKGIALVNPTDRISERDLTEDDDLRDIWNASFRLGEDVQPRAGQWVRALLLAGQRRSNTAKANAEQVRSISEASIGGPPAGDYWVIPSGRKTKQAKVGDSHKNREEQVLPITDAMRNFAGFERERGFFFSANDGNAVGLNSFSDIKKEMDKQIAAIRKAEGRRPMAHWTYHDLRRACRTLASHYTSPDIAERLIGHKLAGVRKVYDKYEYATEKLAALNEVADHILRVVHSTKPPAKKTGNVIPLRDRALRIG
jgi:integrase